MSCFIDVVTADSRAARSYIIQRSFFLPQATLASGSCLRWASSTASLIWSQILSIYKKGRLELASLLQKSTDILYNVGCLNRTCISSGMTDGNYCFALLFGLCLARLYDRLRNGLLTAVIHILYHISGLWRWWERLKRGTPCTRSRTVGINPPPFPRVHV